MSSSSRLFLLYICGKFIITIVRALGVPRRGKARNKLGELHQVHEPHKRSPLPHDNLRIGGGDVGPPRRNGANRVVVDA